MANVSLEKLARILADHYCREDNAFDSADADTKIRFISAAQAVRDALMCEAADE